MVIKLDIVVTIPKKEYKNDDKENDNIINNGHVAFWTLGRLPKNTQINDRVYFVKNGVIDSSMLIVDILQNGKMICETTGRTWQGKCQLMLDDYKKEDATMRMRGFQGFRYFKR